MAVTAYDDEQTFETCMKIGMASVLKKPVSVDLLDKVMRQNYYLEAGDDSSVVEDS